MLTSKATNSNIFKNLVFWRQYQIYGWFFGVFFLGFFWGFFAISKSFERLMSDFENITTKKHGV